MSELNDLLDQEAAAAEHNRDAEIPAEAKVTRGHGRSRTLQVRLNDDELETLEALAQERSLPVSTMVRSLILSALRTDKGTPSERIARLHHELDLLSQQIA